jgi:hypothetical protein
MCVKVCKAMCVCDVCVSGDVCCDMHYAARLSMQTQQKL